MDEEYLKTIVKYKAKGNKNFKNYDAIVTEAVKGKGTCKDKCLEGETIWYIHICSGTYV